MKNTFLRSAICMLILSVTVLTSCKKNNDEPAPEPALTAAGTISLKLDGVKITVPASGVYVVQDGVVAYAMLGATNLGQGIALTITTDKLLSPGSWSYNYPGDGLDLNKKPFIMAIATSSANNDVYSNALNSKVTVNITAASTTHLKGTFSGDVAIHDEATDTYKNKKSVTEGAFDVTLTKSQE